MFGNETIRLTMAQALVNYLQAQYSERDGEQRRLIPAMFGIFGHGNVAGLGQALDEYGSDLPFFQPCNEQSMVHAAIGFAKANRPASRRSPCTSSIGPGATNMITGAALATINRLPVLLLPGDTTRPGTRGRCCSSSSTRSSADVSVNDCFRPVARFFDRITRPEQLLTALPEAMRVLTEPGRDGRGHDRAAAGRPGRTPTTSRRTSSTARVWRDRAAGRPTRERIAEAVALLAAGRAAGASSPAAACTTPRPRRSSRRSPRRSGIPVVRDVRRQGRRAGGRRRWRLGGLGLEGNPAAANARARGRPRARRRHAADRLRDRLAVALPAPGRAVRQRSTSAAATPTSRARCRSSPTRARRCGRCAPARRGRLAPRAGLPGRGRGRAGARGLRSCGARSRPAPTASAMSQGELIGIAERAARGRATRSSPPPGGPPGDLLKLWDATGGRDCHLEFGFSCMGYELPGRPRRAPGAAARARSIVLIGDGTYLMNPTELVDRAAGGAEDHRRHLREPRLPDASAGCR